MCHFFLVLIWGASGPFFHYSESWQLVINTGTTIITFLMVFLIQKAQNKDSLAIQLKLNELVAAHEFAAVQLVTTVENTLEEILKQFRSIIISVPRQKGREFTTISFDR